MTKDTIIKRYLSSISDSVKQSSAAKLYLDERKEEKEWKQTINNLKASLGQTKDNLQKTKNELNAKNQQYDNLLSRVNEIESIINKIKK